MSTKKILRPNPDRWTQPFWDATRQHKLTFQSCSSCGVQRNPAGPSCPSCGGIEFTWSESRGTGAVLSWVTFHQKYYPEYDLEVPYDVVLVQLDDGPRMIAGFFGAGQPTVQERVRIKFVERDATFTLPVFVPELAGD